MNITPEQAKQVEEASHWFEEQDRRAEWSVSECQAWDRWRADADNMAEYEEIGRLQGLLRTVPHPPLPSAAELQESIAKLRDFTTTFDEPGED
jgi:ferric-dicitrate binding protein FerR (iron transport regulator)